MTWEERAAALSTASPQAVWDVLLDGRRWSFWNPGVEWMWLEGDAQPGTLATIKLRGVRQTAFTIVEAVAPRRLALALRIGPVARAEIRWTLAEIANGTRIESVVAIAGIAAGLLLKNSAARAAAAMPASLARLAQHAASLTPSQSSATDT